MPLLWVTMENNKSKYKYLQVCEQDEDWGMVSTTIGYQYILPHAHYPLLPHPDTYNFKKDGGRVLHEYQLVYITAGCGWFQSDSYPLTHLEAGTIILLFPDEWHAYHPDEDTGWDEYWIGFKGKFMDERVKKGFFRPEHCLFHIGYQHEIIDTHMKIAHAAEEEQVGYQQFISGCITQILGSLYYSTFQSTGTISKKEKQMEHARSLIKEIIVNAEAVGLEEVAKRLNISYALFRKEFKQVCGQSPGQYMQEVRLMRAKELLSNTAMSLSEIAYNLRFECVGQFSTFFRQREGITPRDFRKRMYMNGDSK